MDFIRPFTVLKVPPVRFLISLCPCVLVVEILLGPTQDLTDIPTAEQSQSLVFKKVPSIVYGAGKRRVAGGSFKKNARSGAKVFLSTRFSTRNEAHFSTVMKSPAKSSFFRDSLDFTRIFCGNVRMSAIQGSLSSFSLSVSVPRPH